MPAQPFPSTRIISKSPTCTLRCESVPPGVGACDAAPPAVEEEEDAVCAFGCDLDFLRSERARFGSADWERLGRGRGRAALSLDVCVDASSSVCDADADAVALPSAEDDAVRARDRRADAATSADCERGRRAAGESSAAGTGVDGALPPSSSAPFVGAEDAAPAEVSEGAVVEATEALGDRGASGRSSAVAADCALVLAAMETTSRASSSTMSSCRRLLRFALVAPCAAPSSLSVISRAETEEMTWTSTVLGDIMWAARSERTRLMARSTRTLSRSSVRTRTKRFQTRVWRRSWSLEMVVR